MGHFTGISMSCLNSSLVEQNNFARCQKIPDLRLLENTPTFVLHRQKLITEKRHVFTSNYSSGKLTHSRDILTLDTPRYHWNSSCGILSILKARNG